jgi:uncharacterized membrane protein
VSTGLSIALFLHIFSLLAATGAVAFMVLSSLRLRAAKTGAEAFPWGMLAAKTAKTFPAASLGLFLTGGYMVHNVGFKWSAGWVVVGILALVFLNVEGAVLGGGHGKKLAAALKENGPGPVSDHVRELTNEKLHWIVTFGAPGLVLGVVWNMERQSGFGASLLAVIVGYAAGAAVGLWVQANAPAGAPVSVPSTVAS